MAACCIFQGGLGIAALAAGSETMFSNWVVDAVQQAFFEGGLADPSRNACTLPVEHLECNQCVATTGGVSKGASSSITPVVHVQHINNWVEKQSFHSEDNGYNVTK